MLTVKPVRTELINQIVESADIYKKAAGGSALKVAIIYATTGALWILISDKVVAHFSANAQFFAQIQMYKGWGIVSITAILVFFLIRRQIMEVEQLNVKLRQCLNTFKTASFTNIAPTA